MENLTNGILTISVNAHGAELQSIKDAQSGHEYFWDANPKFWNRHSPLLFPIVGGLWNGQYRLNGSVKSLPKHGFLQDGGFELIEQTADTLRYRIQDDAKTRRMYPFPFVLEQAFTLKENKVEVKWSVRTTGQEPMPFQIGGHPSFLFGGFKAGDSLKGFFSFDNPTPESAAVGAGGCVGSHRYKLKMQSDGLMPITDECFSNDAIILDRDQVHAITLHDVTGKPIVTLHTESQVTLMWSPYGVEAPFVCIEPWFGLCDHEGYKGEFAARPYTNCVKPGETWNGGYTIKIHQ